MTNPQRNETRNYGISKTILAAAPSNRRSIDQPKPFLLTRVIIHFIPPITQHINTGNYFTGLVLVTSL
jgi:hypothetical protein